MYRARARTRVCREHQGTAAVTSCVPRARARPHPCARSSACMSAKCSTSCRHMMQGCQNVSSCEWGTGAGWEKAHMRRAGAGMQGAAGAAASALHGARRRSCLLLAAAWRGRSWCKQRAHARTLMSSGRRCTHWRQNAGVSLYRRSLKYVACVWGGGGRPWWRVSVRAGHARWATAVSRAWRAHAVGRCCCCAPGRCRGGRSRPHSRICLPAC